MKFSLIIVVCFIILLVPLLDNSYGQSGKQAQIYLLLQLEIRDSSGFLMGYIESDRAIIADYSTLSNNLDTNAEAMKKRNFTVEGKEFEIFTAIADRTHISKTTYSHSAISGESGLVAFVNHDGFLISPGDRTISTWTIIRTLS